MPPKKKAAKSKAASTRSKSKAKAKTAAKAKPKAKSATKPKTAAKAKAKAKPKAKARTSTKVPTGRNLVVVESPAKAKTISKYLGKDFVVKASMGHVRDLPSKKFGFELPPDGDFEATYEVIKGKTKVVAELRKLAKSAPTVFLATDLDREGEAIAWHLAEALNVPAERQARVTFNEITKRAIQRAFEEPRSIDRDKVDAQQARRFLDRMVGYKLSPLLWRRAGPGTSAGRVQSVALRIIVEREREIRAFKPEVYWTVEARFAREGSPPTPPAPEPEDGKEPGAPPLADGEFAATLARIDGKKAKLADEKVTQGLLDRLDKSAFRVASLKKERKREHPKPPFTTSTLQQQGSIRLRFSAKKTMTLAQRLYQGVSLGSQGQTALITYMRTDSVALSDEAIDGGRATIAKEFGKQYLPAKPNRYKAGKRAQEAHEAIRPTDPSLTPQEVAKHLEKDEARLYDLIWRRFIASQMPPSENDHTTIVVEADGLEFESRGKVVAFDGWRRVMPTRDKDNPDLPDLAEGETVEDRGIRKDRHETQPPPRFSEATLVRTLEKEGIGRPSTYAQIISTIVDRNYVLKEKGRFRATALGEVVNDLLVPFFADIMDVKYTSRMEEDLDRVEDNTLPWKQVLADFWTVFSKDLEHAKVEMKPLKSLPAPEGTDPCEKCGSEMVRKVWKGREFLGCSKYPDCQSSRKVAADGTVLPPPEPTEHKCEKCGKEMVIRAGRRGKFLACTGYPDCKNTKDVDAEGKVIEMPTVDEECEKCGSPMTAKMGRRGPFMACTGYPKCRNAKDLPGVEKKGPETAGVNCPDCGKPMAIRHSRRGPFGGCTGYPQCKKTLSMDKIDHLRATLGVAPDQPADAADDGPEEEDTEE